MAFLKTIAAATSHPNWSSSTSYVVGDGVTYFAHDQIPSTGIRFICIQAHTNQPPTLSTADTYWKIAHPSTSLQMFNTLLACSLSEDFCGVGLEWERKYRFNGLTGLTGTAQRFSVILQNTGLGGQDNINLILNWQQSSNATPTRLIRVGGALDYSGATAAQNDQTFKGAWTVSTSYVLGDVVSSGAKWWVCRLAHTSVTAPSVFSPNWSQLPSNTDADSYSHTLAEPGKYHAHWNGGTGDIPLWLWVNPARIQWVTLSNARFHYSHAGYLRRFGLIAQCPHPFLLAANANAITESWDNNNQTNFPLTHNNRSRFLRQDGNWQDANIDQIRCEPFATSIPYHGRNPANFYGIEEAPIYTSQGLLGAVEQLCYLPPAALTSGTELNVGADTYTVFENVYRGPSAGYLALKNE